MFGKDDKKDSEKDPEVKKDGQNELPAGKAAGGEKTTPDEGKTFEKNTVFVCVQDCFQDGTRYRPGDIVTGKTCPAWFAVRQAEEEKEEE